MQKWDYLEVPCVMERRGAALNEMGADGWELAAAIATMLPGEPTMTMRDGKLVQVGQARPQPGLMLILKRPAADTAELDTEAGDGENQREQRNGILLGR